MNARDLIGNPPPRPGTPAEPEAVPPVISIEPVSKPKRVRTAVMRPEPPQTLVADIAALQERLAASLNVKANARGTYDATAFVTALEAVHERFVQARASLTEWEASLEQREAKIAAREAALSDAEDRASAALRLAKLLPDAPAPKPAKKGWFR